MRSGAYVTCRLRYASEMRSYISGERLGSQSSQLQVSQWLGHSTYTLTLDVYGDWISEEDGGAVNPLPEPTAPAKLQETPTNVVKLFGRQVNCINETRPGRGRGVQAAAPAD